MKNVAIFASGTGSNFQALIDAVHGGSLHVNVKLLICDRPNALVIEKANRASVSTFVFNPKDYKNKAEFEALMIDELQEQQVDLIILAGYMRLIGPTLLNAFKNKIVNIHPSLLPAFPGKDAIQQAVHAGVKITGVTIHYVDEGMDTGPIIAQRAVEIADKDGLKDVERKIHDVEHVFYPETLESLINSKK